MDSISISLTNLGINTPLIKSVSNLSKIIVAIKYYRIKMEQVIRIKFSILSIITKNGMEIFYDKRMEQKGKRKFNQISCKI